jgi:hypothetical protein
LKLSISCFILVKPKKSFFMKILATLSAAALAFCGVTASSAALQWDSLHFMDPDFDGLVRADGVSQLDEDFTFAVGTFAAGFTPTTSNMADWQTNWHGIANATSMNGGWDVPNQQLIGYTNFTSSGVADTAPGGSTYNFSEGDQVYIWIYNSQDLVEGSEWALVTRDIPAGSSIPEMFDWRLPNMGSSNEDRVLLQDADLAIVGSTISTADQPSSGSAPYDIRLQSVPEPGSALLIAALGLVIRFRRGTRRGMPKAA